MFAQRMQHLNSSFIRDILAVTQRPDVISFAGGLPDPALFPVLELQQAAETMQLRQGAALYQYSETAGILPLREQIAGPAGLSTEQIVVTTGSQQGLDLITRCLLDPGGLVAVEAPTYLGALQVFRANQVELVSIPSDNKGPDLDALEIQLSRHPIDCFYTVTDFQNPTGACYSLARRQRLVQLAEQYGFWILEDAPYRALRYQGDTLPSLFELAPERVIQLGSFSKIIAPALRLGWIQALRPVIEQVEKLKQAADLHSSGYDQHLVRQFLAQGSLEPHLERIRNAYRQRRDTMAYALSTIGTLRFSLPEGGMFIWATLPEGRDTFALFEQAIQQGVAFVPGQAFYADNASTRSMRLNFSNSTESQIRNGIDRLAALIAGTAPKTTRAASAVN